MKNETDENYSDQETKRRQKKALAGAFAGPPTALKAIPKKNGELRTQGAEAPKKARRRARKP